MRAKRAKKLKYMVMAEMYGIELTVVQKDAILNDKKFKNIYRNRKRNYMKNRSA